MADAAANLFDLLADGALAAGAQRGDDGDDGDLMMAATQAAAAESAPTAGKTAAGDAETGAEATAIGSAACSTCGLKFEDLKAQRAHFKTDLHRLNLKRRAAGKTALSEAEAEAALDDDAESLSGSGSESEDLSSEGEGQDAGDDEDDPETAAAGDRAVRREQASMMVGLKMVGTETSTLAWVPAAVALDRKREHEDVAQLKEKPLWVILLHGAGHFAGVVLRNGRDVVASKSFHRYVIRAKQGKAQSANDSAKGNAKSAGAGIRRYNEQMLKTEIGELLQSWAQHIEAASRVFISISKTNQHIFFSNEALLSSKDPRVRRIPFPVRRPTVKGASEVGARLATARLEPEAAYRARKADAEAKRKAADEREKARLARAAAKATPPKPPDDAAAKATPPEPEPEDPELVRAMLEACEAGDVAGVIMCIGQDAEVLHVVSRRNHGNTPLHVAAQAGHADLVRTLLDNGASPNIPNNHGKLPYHCASESRDCRDAFRRFRGDHPDKWDYDRAAIPEAITDEGEAAKKQRQKERKKRQAQRKREEKERERARQEEAVKRKEAEEAAAMANAPSCAACNKKLLGKPSQWFTRLHYFYCSPECMQLHRRKLQADAALARFAKK